MDTTSAMLSENKVMKKNIGEAKDIMVIRGDDKATTVYDKL
jgi:hypothetical protein